MGEFLSKIYLVDGGSLVLSHSVLANVNAIILIPIVFDRFSNVNREVCRKYPTLLYFLIRDFVDDDTLFKTCAYSKPKCLSCAQKSPKSSNEHTTLGTYKLSCAGVLFV
ncbi:hypothetical protein XV76_15530 [Vibrio cholerae]|nr:hypothetical protein XV73_16695 [Vibrio cholerae]KQA34232.1 hypothetical protein XV72_07300 [Vibrio cholerae]KQA41501.1 hypothetical protein XV76_15530 [Vibrio cholerae]KQA66055.1 hypothetical protein XV82_14175 [Vibrio cholerae]KQA80756.1 hypothetical protein XV87_16540 [Vibrio cholerae]